MPTIYIAGKVSGLPYELVREKFDKRQEELEREGHTVINPLDYIQYRNDEREASGLHRLDDNNPADRKMIMSYCISIMVLCDGVELLHDWQESTGAIMEHDVAQRIGMKIGYPL